MATQALLGWYGFKLQDAKINSVDYGLDLPVSTLGWSGW